MINRLIYGLIDWLINRLIHNPYNVQSRKEADEDMATQPD